MEVEDLTNRQRLLRLLVLLALTALVAIGCRQVDPQIDPSVVEQPASEHLAPVAERPAIPEFVVKDFVSDQEIAFPLSSEEGKISVFNFFSPG